MTSHLEAIAGAVAGELSLPGLVVGVGRRDGPQEVAATGCSAHGRPTRADDRFLLTSVTKAVTAVQIHLLAQDGLIGLHEPIAVHLPEFGSRGQDKITPCQILSHTSGIDPSTCNDAEVADSPKGPDELYDDVCRAGLAFQPGSRVEYCSPPFWALSRLVERATGTSLQQHFLSEMAAPLGMSDTRYEPSAAQPDRYVAPSDTRYDDLAERVRRLAYPAGGLVGTTADLLRFGQAQLDGPEPLLSAPARAHLHHVVTRGLPGARSPSQGRWAAERTPGWAVGGPGERRHDATLWHNGASGPSLWVDDSRGVALVLLTSSWHLEADALGVVVDALLDHVDARRDGTG